MELRDGYWVDVNNNKWDADFYSEEEALKYSTTLTDCSSCWDCSDCRCCICCIGCHGCRNCSYCFRCNDCSYCGRCTECSSCTYCSDCKRCRNCIECSYCNSFCKNPERIIGSAMGSRSAQPAVYWVEVGKEQCVVGCFRGTLDELERAVEKTHKNNEKYLNEYKNFIAKVRAYQGVIK